MELERRFLSLEILSCAKKYTREVAFSLPLIKNIAYGVRLYKLFSRAEKHEKGL